MNQQQLQIARRQWKQLGPKVITTELNGKDKKFKFDDKRTLCDDGNLLLRYVGRKAKGEFFAPMVQITLHLDEGKDLYDLKAETFNSEIEKVAEKEFFGLFVDCFENFATI